MRTTRKSGRKAEPSPGPEPRTAPDRRAGGARPIPYTPAARADRDTTLERWLHGGVTLEEACRVRAYQLWERAGRPAGDGAAFWLEAERELTAGG